MFMFSKYDVIEITILSALTIVYLDYIAAIIWFICTLNRINTGKLD